MRKNRLINLALEDYDQEAVVMPNKDGEKFLCYFPKVDKPEIGKPVTPNISSSVVGTEKCFKWKMPDELLEVLKDYCLIRQQGWWSYELCYEKQLRQVYLEDKKLSKRGGSLMAVRDKYKLHKFKCVSMLTSHVEIPASFFEDTR